MGSANRLQGGRVATKKNRGIESNKSSLAEDGKVFTTDRTVLPPMVIDDEEKPTRIPNPAEPGVDTGNVMSLSASDM